MPAPRSATGLAAKPMRWVFTWPYRVALAGVYRAGFKPWQLTLLALADFVVLSDDPTRIAVNDLLRLQAEHVYVHGASVNHLL